MKPLALITCGPASEPVDEVRRITNFSTGEIGAHLVEAAQNRGFETVCFRGTGATARRPPGTVIEFSSNASLVEALGGSKRSPSVIFHAAALSDFVVSKIEGAAGKKLSSRGPDVRLTLAPAPKILPHLRTWFPEARIVGWKYELDGSRDDAVARAAAQIVECRSDACVVNGRAFGDGFGVLFPDGRLEEIPDKPLLARALCDMFPP